MQTVYFVRHGQTEGNVQNHLQGLDDRLTATGRSQAEIVAQRLSKVPFDILLSSDAIRARDTASYICNVTGRPVETSELFREMRPPSDLIGVPRTSDAALLYYHARSTAVDEHFRYSDEESFADLKARAVDALQFIINQPHPAIVVVTHGHFLRFLFATMLFGETLTLPEWHRTASFLEITNTAITVVHQKENHWSLLAWNDHAHLAD